MADKTVLPTGELDDASSRHVAHPTPAGPTRNEAVNRTIHFWDDGFSVDDGDLYRSDDPRNVVFLNTIREGRAPLSVMNVLPGQEIDVEIIHHQEKYSHVEESNRSEDDYLMESLPDFDEESSSSSSSESVERLNLNALGSMFTLFLAFGTC